MTDARPTIVFAGDSITDSGRCADGTDVGRGYVAILARELGAFRLINAGRSGDRAVDLGARFRTDVLSHSPRIVSILIGVNDTGRRYDSDDPTSPRAFRESYEGMLSSARARGCALVIMTPFLLPMNRDQERWKAEDLDAKIAVTHELAGEFGAVLIDLQNRLGSLAHESGVAAIAPDGVHPSEAGHLAIAATWAEATQDLLSDATLGRGVSGTRRR